eukprot:6206072-Pleurochrysis_carterae.AAC.2
MLKPFSSIYTLRTQWIRPRLLPLPFLSPHYLTLPAPASAAGPTTRSAGAAPGAAPAASAGQPPSTAPVSTVRSLSTDERNHFVISLETLANFDRQLMETFLGTISSPANHPAYRSQCQNSGRVLIRILINEANAWSPSAGLAINSMMESLLIRGLSEASVVDFNTLLHDYTRLNRSLPAHSRLGDSLVAEKLCAAMRRIGESITTKFDVMLMMRNA